MSELAIIGVSDLATLDLTDLAEVANREHGLALAAGLSMLEHAINAGEALLEVRARVPVGGWEPWVAEHFHASNCTAWNYARIARHKDLVRDRGITSQRQAITYLRQVAPAVRFGDDVRDEVRRLAKAGYSKKATSEMLGIHRRSVQRYLNPELYKRAGRERRAQQAAALAALRREQRDKAARSAGGDVAEAYALARRLAAALESAAATEQNPDAKQALASALHRLYRVEDEVVKAVGTSNPAAREAAA